MRGLRRVIVSAGLLALLAGAGPFDRHREGTPPPGKPRCIPHTDERAGDPRCIGHFAAPSINPTGVGYYVGGGSWLRNNVVSRCPDDGTWGWDETGSRFLPRRVSLGWSHWRAQGGAGYYRTDRPHGPLRRLLPGARELGN